MYSHVTEMPKLLWLTTHIIWNCVIIFITRVTKRGTDGDLNILKGFDIRLICILQSRIKYLIHWGVTFLTRWGRGKVELFSTLACIHWNITELKWGYFNNLWNKYHKGPTRSHDRKIPVEFCHWSLSKQSRFISENCGCQPVKAENN